MQSSHESIVTVCSSCIVSATINIHVNVNCVKYSGKVEDKKSAYTVNVNERTRQAIFAMPQNKEMETTAIKPQTLEMFSFGS